MNDEQNLDDYTWLTSDDGCKWLDAAACSERSPLALTTQLRKDLSQNRVRLVLEQVTLRKRAKAKFSHPNSMFFTPLGLEQATDEWIASYKAERFSKDTCVADLCCGVGGDLISLARESSVTGIDLDPVSVLFANTNLRLLEQESCLQAGSTVQTCDAESVDLQIFGAWHCDPDRRSTGRRTTDAASYSPNQDTLSDLLNKNENAAIKLAPASRAAEEWTHQAEWEWVSRSRECKQLVGWFGQLAKNSGEHTATIVYSNGRPSVSFHGKPNVPCAATHTIGKYLYVPDPAVFAARLSSTLAERHELLQVAGEGLPPSGYLTGEQLINEPLAACFEVVEVLSFDLKKLKSYVRAKNIGRLEIKQRGVDFSPETLRKKLQAKGDSSATIILSHVGKRIVAIMAQRIDQNDNS